MWLIFDLRLRKNNILERDFVVIYQPLIHIKTIIYLSSNSIPQTSHSCWKIPSRSTKFTVTGQLRVGEAIWHRIWRFEFRDVTLLDRFRFKARLSHYLFIAGGNIGSYLSQRYLRTSKCKKRQWNIELGSPFPKSELLSVKLPCLNILCVMS